MKASIVTKDRNTCPASGAGKTYSVGCLPLLLVWFLVDLIGTACHAGATCCDRRSGRAGARPSR